MFKASTSTAISVHFLFTKLISSYFLEKTILFYFSSIRGLTTTDRKASWHPFSGYSLSSIVRRLAHPVTP